jgi:pyruvate kinase
MIIATLPPLYRTELVELIAGHPLIDAFRYNTGMDAAESPMEILKRLRQLADRHGKKLWLDLKGRQLRIVEWAAPNYGKIKLNHKIQVEGPAKVYFRGSGWTDLKFTNDKFIYVDPPPPQAVGRGQAVNVVGEQVKIQGYLTPLDKAFILAANAIKVDALLLSFVEQQSDLDQAVSMFGRPASQPTIGLKIETAKGLAFAKEFFSGETDFGYFPILARDDLSNELPNGVAVTIATEEIIKQCPRPVAASKFFQRILTGNEADAADFSDWHWLHQLGYRDFLLQDELCLDDTVFLSAMQAIEDYDWTFLNQNERTNNG